MPITFPAHAAAVIPLSWGRWLPGTALVVGSAAPDFAFLIRGEAGVFSHSLWGLVFFVPPVGALVYALLESVLVPELRRVHHVLAVVLASRGLARSRRDWAAVFIALLLGALTHLAWDRLTHGDRWPADALLGLAGAARAHLVSSVGGSLVVLIWCLLRYRSRRERAADAAPARGGLALLAAALTGALAAFAAQTQVSWLNETFSTGWSAFAGALLAVTVLALARRPT